MVKEVCLNVQKSVFLCKEICMLVKIVSGNTIALLSLAKSLFGSIQEWDLILTMQARIGDNFCNIFLTVHLGLCSKKNGTFFQFKLSR